MVHALLRFLVILIVLVAATTADAATKKKKVKPPEKPKAAYELPMKVVIVRSSEPGCEPNCPQWIMADGEITPASPAQFRKALKQAGKLKLPVVIRSPGGHVTSALEIGRMIRKAGLNVAVGWTNYSGCAPADKSCKLPKEQEGIYRGLAMSGGYAFCNSACPFILMAGEIRLSGHGAYIGTHQVRTKWTRERVYYRERYRMVKGKKKVVERKVTGRKTVKSYETVGQDKALRKKLNAYFKEMGIEQAFLAEMDKAPPTTLFQLPVRRQMELKLVTSSMDVTAFTRNSVCAAEATGEHCVLRKSKGKVAPEEQSAPQLLYPKSPAAAVLVQSSLGGCRPLCPRWFYLAGDITKQSLEDLTRLLEVPHADKLPLVLNASSGDVGAAMAIGRLVRKYNMATIVGGVAFKGCDPIKNLCPTDKSGTFLGDVHGKYECSAACALVFVAGSIRYGTNATIKFLPVDTSGYRWDQATPYSTSSLAMREYLKSMGIATELYDQRMQPGAVDPGPQERSRDMSVYNITNARVKISAFLTAVACKGTVPAAHCLAATIDTPQ